MSQDLLQQMQKENPLFVLDVVDARDDDETRDGAGLPCLSNKRQLRYERSHRQGTRKVLTNSTLD